MPPGVVLLAAALLCCPTLGHGAGSDAGMAGAGAEPPWAKKLEASVTKISEEQNHLAQEFKRLSKAETAQAVPLHGGPVDTRSALAKSWLSASSQRSRTGSLQSNAACPAIATGHMTIYLEPRVWSPAYTVDVLVADEKAGGKKTVVGTIYAKMFDFHSNMTLYNTKGEMVSSSKKWIITTIDETFIYDCQGNEVMHFTENSQRSKHNKVERYEMEDKDANELGSTRMYYNYGGNLQIHAPNGKTLGVATAPWSWYWSDWTFKIKPEFYAEGEGISVDGIYPTLLWLAEEDNGFLGSGPILSMIGSIVWWVMIVGCAIACQCVTKD